SLELILNSSLNLTYRHRRRQKKVSLLEIVSYAVDATQYAYAFHNPRPVPLSELSKRYFYLDEVGNFDEITDEQDNSHYPKFEDIRKCTELVENTKQIRKLEADLWATNLTPWSDLVEVIRQRWGDKWICFHLANIASGIKSSTETYTDHSDLLDYSKNLCKRVRYARLRAGQYAWWEKQFELADSEIDKALSLLVVITWASSKTLVKMISKLDEFVQNLSDTNWKNVYSSVEEAVNLPRSSHQQVSLDPGKVDNLLHPRTAVLISLRAKPTTRKSIYSKYLKEYDGSDALILKICHDMSLEFLANDYSVWDEVRDAIQRSYARGVVFDPYTFHRLSREITSRSIPEDIALEIASQPSNYPGFLVAIAEMKMKEKVASKVVPVGDTAIKNRWFEHL
ncbi:MAG: hypothetical protein AAF959_26515, partial [Cyanobacteria bacterium P01_D01_bin.56]